MNKTQQTQLELAQAIRNPEQAYSNFDSRRLAVYQDLFFNNVLGFCDSAFPVLKSIFDEDDWRPLIRTFFIEHQCQTPHFSEIAQEFVNFLATNPNYLPNPCLLELAHYEWVELAVSVAPTNEADNQDNFRVAESTFPLAYSCPVQSITANNFRDIEQTPTFLVVYRDRDLEVNFVEADHLSVVLLTHIKQQPQTKSELQAFLTSEHVQMSAHEAEKYLAKALPEFCRRGIVNG